MDLEKRVAELEKEIEKLKECKHIWIKGRNGYPQVYFNMCGNGYYQCERCGKKERI